MAYKYRRGKVWWIKYYVEGKEIRHSLKTQDKTVAQFKKNEIENELAKGDNPLPDVGMTAAQCVEEFRKFRAGRLDPKTIANDHYRIERFIHDERIAKLKQISQMSLKDHLDKRIESEKISNRTANHTIRAVKTFLNFCVRQKYIHGNAIKGMETYPIHEQEPRFLTVEEVRALLAAAKGQEVFPIVATAVYTGMRLGEILRLEWQDVDFEGGIISVRKSKSKKFRKIPIHRDLKRILWSLRGSGRCFKVPSYHSVEWRFSVVRKKLQIPFFRFHDLRHTFASMLIRRGVDILTVSKLLGHSSVVVTQIYAHLYEDHVQESIQKIRI